MNSSARPAVLAFALLAACVGALAVASVLVGPAAVSFGGVPGPGSLDVGTLWAVRGPRAALAMLVGAALGASGAAFQGLFRNPLADPFIVGSSSGAAAGVAVALVFGLGTPTLAAFAGSVGAVALVFAVASVGRMPPAGLLLAGAAVSTMLSAVVWLMIALSGGQLQQIIGFLMGGLAGRDWADARAAAPLILLGIAALTVAGRGLDAVAAGDSVARALGLPLNVFAGGVLMASSLAVAAAVAAGGVVGFVGLAAPHLARPLVGARHALSVPASALVGAGIVLIADAVARATAPPLELPLGVLTSLIGGPFFLVVLRRGPGRD